VLVDCLNTLSLIYSYLEVDTAQSYARRAHNEADKIGYGRGKVMSLNNQAHIAGYTQNNFMVQEKISLETIPMAKGLSDTKVIGDTYMNLALALFCQGFFDRSAEVCIKILDLASGSGNVNLLGESQAVMGSIRFETGNYEESFNYFNKSLANFSATGDSYNRAIINAKIGDLHNLAGDSKTALDYYFKSLAYPKGASLKWHPLVDLGDTYYSSEPVDTTRFDQDRYIQSIKALTIRSNNLSLPRIQVAEKHIAAGRYNEAIDMLVRDLEVSRTSNHKGLVMRVLLDLGRAYHEKKEYQRRRKLGVE
jgi:tetratricopeptide (TPR) repeat protein